MRGLVIATAASVFMFLGMAQNRGAGTHSGTTGAGVFGGNHHGGFTGVGPRSGGGFISPPAGSIINPGIPNGLNWNNAWRGYGSTYRGRFTGGRRGGYGGYGYGGYSAGILAYPVFVGPSPYDYSYLPPGYEDQPPPAPAVIINQNFIPEHANPMVREYGSDDQEQQPSGMRNYQNVPPRQPEAEATIYLIAFKDHSVVPALGWWLEGSTLKYVNLDHEINQASVDLIDRDLSRKINAQRNIDFTLPNTAPQR